HDPHAYLKDVLTRLPVTNLPTADLSAEAAVARYKALADIERGFRVLKNEIEMGPVFHRLSSRIRAHALICFLALLLHRVLRMRLRANHSTLSPERALEIARRIRFHQVTLHRQHTASGLTSLTPEQRQLFAALDLLEPAVQHV
ncbi:MAG: IS1634 family transposase, partial [Lautropia sp.]|nr:IS1634 family transposase [Lautropia sp.]